MTWKLFSLKTTKNNQGSETTVGGGKRWAHELMQEKYIPIQPKWKYYERQCGHSKIVLSSISTSAIGSFEVFSDNTNLTFLYKFDQGVLKVFSQKNCLQWKLNSQLTSTGLEDWCLFNCANQTCVEERFFKLNFVSCITSLFGLGSFLYSIWHDFTRIWKSETGKAWQVSTVG